MRNCVAAFNRIGQCLQTLHQGGQQCTLIVQQLPGAFLPMIAGEYLQRAGDGGIQGTRSEQTLAAAQRRQHAQYCGTGNPCDRGAEGVAQTLHRRGQRIADRLQIAGAFQRDAGAAQGDHHPQQRAQHAQQNQHPGQIRRQGGSRQRHALAGHTQTHRSAQRDIQCVQPMRKFRRGVLQGIQRRLQTRRSLAITLQLGATNQVHHGNQQAHPQHHRIIAGMHCGHPGHHNQAQHEQSGARQTVQERLPSGERMRPEWFLGLRLVVHRVFHQGHCSAACKPSIGRKRASSSANCRLRTSR